MIDELLHDARVHMDKSVDATRHKFGSVRTGRASPSLLDRITVDYYGAQTPLRQLSTVNAPEARLLTVQPYDKGSIKAIERAIMESDLGLTPNNDGSIIRLQIPELTEERRKQLVKVVRGLTEDGKGRWAQQHGVPVSEGHKAGADTVKARLRDAVDLGIRELTIYSFSTENWNRPQDEVDALMALFSARIIDETPELHEEGVKMRFVGRREGVLPELLEQMHWAED